MIRAWFLVLCRDEDNKGACERTKALMHDCEVGDAEPTAAYNHVGVREFDDEDEAVARMVEIKRAAGRDVIDVSVRVKYRVRRGWPTWRKLRPPRLRAWD